MPRPESELLPPKPEARLRIYAYSIADDAHAGLLKVGQTTQDVKVRVAQQLKTAAIENYQIVIDEPADRPDGSVFTDFDVRQRLKQKGFDKSTLEWMRCTVADVRTAIAELRVNKEYEGTHHLDFPPRREQQDAIEKTYAYFQDRWSEDADAFPEFLWNAKMRFGKTFTTYKLAQKMRAKRVLVVTFKPAVEDAWENDLRTHVDFDGWQYLSKAAGGDPTSVDPDRPLVFFGSFQDLLGKDKAGNFKPKHKWLTEVTWDLVVFDEYHFGAWRDTAKELFDGEDESSKKRATAQEFGSDLDTFTEEREVNGLDEDAIIPIKARSYLYLSGTPFKVLNEGRFIEEQIYNWTYTDEQRAKAEFVQQHPSEPNPYAALPEMRLLTYQMPDELIAIANQGEFDEFDLNAFFEAKGVGEQAAFTHKNDVQKWLDIIRGNYAPTQVDALKTGTRPPFPYSDVRLLPYLQHSLWMLPSTAACAAMENLLAESQNAYWRDYRVVNVSKPSVGVGLAALPPVRQAIGAGFDTKTITLTVGKLTTGVTVPQWSAILMLRNLNAPETYFQAAFRVQSPWVIRNPNGDDPHEETIFKPVSFVFDFAPTRALRQISEYGRGLSPETPNPEKAVEELVSFLPVLAYDGSNMTQVDAAGILDMAMAGTSATLLARKWESAVLVNVDNQTLKKIMSSDAAMNAVMNIEGFRALGSSVFETVVNKSEAVTKTRKEKGDDITSTEKKELTAEEKEYKSKRKQIQEKLIKFATRIPAFMYLTDYREHTLKDVITKIEPELFRAVTGLTVADFELLVSLGVFNASHMNQAVFAFRRYEDASLSYTGVESHEGLRRYGLYDTVVAVDERPAI
ncbi:type III restriction system endonuclease, putative [Microbacterium esteraromaticum]|uniref:Type III restriction system endonuclease, putative n=1 Tax=Microbacterium esteraromaticum TaxID=57043 RepID=A0A1R4KQD7_9MICO|nr:DEAD/DEAH box helicase family protein [Microbacterium esteraromaticum]SJN46601.1 type III restriction system endonuclease, putative [Microbacterium esteraromaticum]